ncbi:MAG: ABC transporter, partial [Ilumatobacteraceae bacterium]
MTDYLFFLLLGVGAGAIIAAFGLGLLVTHQGSGVVNFAYGATASWAAYVYADLRRGAYTFPVPGLPARYHFGGGDVGYRWAMALALLTAVLLGLAIYWLVVRPLLRAPALAKVVASIGLVIVFISLIERRFSDTSGTRVKAILPKEPVTFAEGITVPRDGLWLAAIVVALAAGVWLASRYTRLGLVTRAAAENEKGAVLLGYSPSLLAGASFVLAGLIGAVVAILAAPMIQLSSGIYTFAFLVPALGAALIGKFRSVWPTVGTGMAIGMVQSTFTKMQNDFSWFPEYGARQGLPFIVIIIAIVVLGERLPERGSVDTWRLPVVPPARVTPWAVGVPVVAAVVGLFAFGPLWRGAIMTSTIAVVLALSLVVLTGFGGQTSLSQMAFAGVAGFALSRLAMRWGVPFPIAPVLAASIAMAFGVLVGMPALRVRGTNLAIVTLAGGVAITEFVFKNPEYVGDPSTGGAKVPNPKLGDWDLGLVLGNQASR